MDVKNKMLFALIASVTISVVSILMAYISFNILESSAEASLQNWKLGGAFAGFAFTASLLTSITLQFYKQMTTDQISKYRDQIQELQSKLIRGAPCPKECMIEVNENYKLIFARPKKWVPEKDIIYQFAEKEGKACFRVALLCKHDLIEFYEDQKLGKFDPDDVDVDRLYDKYVAKEERTISEDSKKDSLKGHTLIDGLESLRWDYPRTTTKEKEKMKFRHSEIFTYVPQSKALFVFRFDVEEEDYRKSSEILTNIIRSIRFLP